ncbi:iron uptake system protein EfeO [Saccharopolyspora dendranthemae]|uniref:Iron uptake system component EfeO n=1 Tax=Saccharopolyspora dendranthemae TaxID=1181886 RepID=A0A561V8C7_9PSEU|nr:iron uptake system protein EfeO [Saccharopolyspora dendranthemae]TWG07869.1 iron uptake system component EfeO [Saccharopolyspora dendranthemae]
MRTAVRKALPLSLLLLASCGQQAGPAPGAISVEAGDDSCKVSSTSAAAGTITFDVRNTGSQVTEFYLLGDGDKIVSEVENIGPGMNRQLVAQVPQGGKYTTACKPGMQGDGIRGEFTVTGSAQAVTSPEAAQAVTAYKSYVDQQADALAAETGKFVQAVKSGDVEQAKALYPAARLPWERIEPVAESFGDLDPKIDGREADLEPGQQFTGYHRLEKDLWVTGPQPDTPAIADQLRADVDQLVAEAHGVELTPADAANGAKELLDEVATGKVTGEEEIFSHTDLWDFQANVAGAKQVVESLRPVLSSKDPELLAELDRNFGSVQALLDRYRTGEGFRLYQELRPEQVKELSESVNSLGEPLSKTAGVVAR